MSIYTRPLSLIQIAFVALTALTIASCGGQEEAAGPEFTIANITGNLYEARTPSHNTVFLVTPDGVILADPLRVDFAEWLKAELLTRFDATVRYVLYSHHHPDHAAGGHTFADTATYVGHQTMATMLNGPLPSNVVAQDTNGNGTIERIEARGGYLANFDLYDSNGNDSVTGAEIHAGTHQLDVVYTDRMTVTLGGSTVEMHYSSPAHSEDMTVLLFPEERTAFAVDFVHVTRFPGTLSGYSVERYVTALEELQALDFDILVPGHGDVGVKSDLAPFVTFLQTLEADVAAGIAQGQTVEELRESVLLPDYADWLLYDARRANLVAEMHAMLSAQ